jgi:hypothetical protein
MDMRAFILLHDVKGPAAPERIEPPLEIQHRYGLTSGSTSRLRPPRSAETQLRGIHL